MDPSEGLGRVYSGEGPSEVTVGSVKRRVKRHEVTVKRVNSRTGPVCPTRTSLPLLPWIVHSRALPGKTRDTKPRGEGVDHPVWTGGVGPGRREGRPWERTEGFVGGLTDGRKQKDLRGAGLDRRRSKGSLDPETSPVGLTTPRDQRGGTSEVG